MTIATPDEWEAKCDEMAEKLRQPKYDGTTVELERAGNHFYGSINGDTISVDSRNRIDELGQPAGKSVFLADMVPEMIGFHADVVGHFDCVVLNRLHPRVERHLNSENYTALADMCVWIHCCDDSEALDLVAGWLSRSEVTVDPF